MIYFIWENQSSPDFNDEIGPCHGRVGLIVGNCFVDNLSGNALFAELLINLIFLQRKKALYKYPGHSYEEERCGELSSNRGSNIILLYVTGEKRKGCHCLTRGV